MAIATRFRRESRPRRALRAPFGVSVVAVGLLIGCSTTNVLEHADVTHYRSTGPDEFVDTTSGHDTIEHVAPPSCVIQGDPEYWDVSLNEVVRIALENSEVLRDLGGTVLRAPDSLVTRYRSHLQFSDPRFGVEGALSEFDAEFLASATFEKNDRPFNNTFFGGGSTLFTQDLHVYQAELNKTAATGTRFAGRTVTTYDANNAPANTFNSAFETALEAEVRQPLWRGAGVVFNRIAGPNATEGEYNGVLIARVNTEISETEFELAVRDYVSNVENAYWDLYYAYRDLEAKKAARDAALRIWRKLNERVEQDVASTAEQDTAKTALEQYYRLQAEVETALTGKLFERTQNRNGAPGGALRGIAGVHVAERRLRLLVGIPINDHLLMRPDGDPPVQEIAFDWDGLLLESMSRRPELRQQKLRVRRREMELTASRNFLKPQLDAVGLYRWRGFGKDLLDQHSDATFLLSRGGTAADVRFKNAAENLVEGGFQEWQLGVELVVPIGFRKAHAAVRNAEFELSRERSLLREQERQIVHDLSNALGETKRAHRALRTAYNRREVARQLVKDFEDRDRKGIRIDFDRYLDAHRRLSDASGFYYLALAEYAIALKNVNFERGSLLDEHELLLADRVDAAGIDDVTTLGPSRTMVPMVPEDLPGGDEESPVDDLPLPSAPADPDGPLPDLSAESSNDSNVRTAAGEEPASERSFFERHALAITPGEESRQPAPVNALAKELAPVRVGGDADPAWMRTESTPDPVADADGTWSARK